MKKLLILLSLFNVHCVMAQYDHENVLPGQTGQELTDQLKALFKPELVLSFADAKDTLYGRIYKEKDSVSCVYTGHSIYLPQGEDPSTWLYQNGSQDGINAEHNYPKSKGASDGNALSDLYNLFPSRLQVNADRGNLPFGEIADDLTQYWYYLTNKTTMIPGQNIERYSEGSNTAFEPREDHKGNVARSIFYFITIYDQEVQEADPLFFESMKSTLCDWHYQDPVDSLEWVRNDRIASYQSGKKNPFILDCSLAGRSYCEQIDAACLATGLEETLVTEGPEWALFPNPLKRQFTLRSLRPQDSPISITLYDTMGKLSMQRTLSQDPGHPDRYLIHDVPVLPKGIYFLIICSDSEHREVKKVWID